MILVAEDYKSVIQILERELMQKLLHRLICRQNRTTALPCPKVYVMTMYDYTLRGFVASTMNLESHR